MHVFIEHAAGSMQSLLFNICSLETLSFLYKGFVGMNNKHLLNIHKYSYLMIQLAT